MAAQEPNSRLPGVRNHSLGTIINLGSANSYIAPASIIPYTVSKNDIIVHCKYFLLRALNSSLIREPGSAAEILNRGGMLAKLGLRTSRKQTPKIVDHGSNITQPGTLSGLVSDKDAEPIQPKLTSGLPKGQISLRPLNSDWKGGVNWLRKLGSPLGDPH